eukprot:Opistho-2@20014
MSSVIGPASCVAGIPSGSPLPSMRSVSCVCTTPSEPVAGGGCGRPGDDGDACPPGDASGHSPHSDSSCAASKNSSLSSSSFCGAVASLLLRLQLMRSRAASRSILLCMQQLSICSFWCSTHRDMSGSAGRPSLWPSPPLIRGSRVRLSQCHRISRRNSVQNSATPRIPPCRLPTRQRYTASRCVSVSAGAAFSRRASASQRRASGVTPSPALSGLSWLSGSSENRSANTRSMSSIRGGSPSPSTSEDMARSTDAVTRDVMWPTDDESAETDRPTTFGIIRDDGSVSARDASFPARLSPAPDGGGELAPESRAADADIAAAAAESALRSAFTRSESKSTSHAQQAT